MSSMIIGETYDLLLKMVVIGDSGVGKTNLLSRFQRDQFTQQSKPTIGVEFATKTVAMQNHKIKVQIWDTAGQQRFRAITHAYYKGALGALIVFDLSRYSTFENISKWLKQLKQNAEEKIAIILIGNKSDLIETRAIKLQEIEMFAEQNNLAYLQVSAKQNKNVIEAFHKVIEKICSSLNSKPKDNDKNQKQEKNVVKNTSPTKKNISISPAVHKQNSQKSRKKCC